MRSPEIDSLVIIIFIIRFFPIFQDKLCLNFKQLYPRSFCDRLHAARQIRREKNQGLSPQFARLPLEIQREKNPYYWNKENDRRTTAYKNKSLLSNRPSEGSELIDDADIKEEIIENSGTELTFFSNSRSLDLSHFGGSFGEP